MALFWAHWFAFQMTAVMLNRWKFKYLFHDWYKPWLKMFGMEYKKSKNSIEITLITILNIYSTQFMKRIVISN